MFEPSLKSLTHRGKFVEIWSVGDRRVSFDRLDFYHNESQLFGLDTRARDAVESSSLLESLVPFLEQDIFQPPAVDRVIALADGRTAYEAVASGKARGRLVMVPRALRNNGDANANGAQSRRARGQRTGLAG